MFPFFLFLNRSFSFLRHCCVFAFRSRFPTVFRQFSPTLFPLFHSFLSCLLSYWLSFVHCISSVPSDFVCFLCRSLSFLCFPKSFFSFLTSLLCVSSLGFPLYFVNSLWP